MTTPAPTFDEFRRQKLDQGFDEVIERSWDPGTVLETHRHPFDADALVVQGEMWLAVDGAAARRLLPGDRFEVPADVPHHERYGAQGATYWVARRNR